MSGGTAGIGPCGSPGRCGSASMASRRTPASCAACTMRTPTSRVRTQRARPLCASLAITTGACPNPHRTRSSTGRQPSTATSRRYQQTPPSKLAPRPIVTIQPARAAPALVCSAPPALACLSAGPAYPADRLRLPGPRVPPTGRRPAPPAGPACPVCPPGPACPADRLRLRARVSRLPPGPACPADRLRLPGPRAPFVLPGPACPADRLRLPRNLRPRGPRTLMLPSDTSPQPLRCDIVAVLSATM